MGVISEENRVDGKLVCWTCLVPNSKERWRVIAHWQGEKATVKEVGQLRALVREFQQKSSKELWQELKVMREVDLGEYNKPHLERLLRQNEKYGLNLEVKNRLADDASEPPLERLVKAIDRDDAGEVARLATQVPDLNVLIEEGFGLLAHALYAEHEAAARALVEAGIELANPKAIFTPIQAALECGLHDSIDLLLERNVDVTVRGAREADDPIHVLCRNFRSVDWLKRFLELGADPMGKNDNGETAIDVMKESIEFDGEDEEALSMLSLLERHVPGSAG